jgi:hypothetical protein
VQVRVADPAVQNLYHHIVISSAPERNIMRVLHPTLYMER